MNDYLTDQDILDRLHEEGQEPELDNTVPVLKRTIEDFCGTRDEALRLLSHEVEGAWNMFIAALDRANELIKLSAPTQSRVYFGSLEFGKIAEDSKGDGDRAETYRRRIDAAVWRHLLESTDIGKVLDAQGREEFRAGLENPPPITVETCAATLKSLLDNGADMQRRGLVKIFTSLNSQDYVSNDCFSIGKRIVVEYAVDRYSGGFWFRHSSYHNRRDALIDLERAIDLVEGRDVKTAEESIVRVLEAKNMRGGFHEDDVFKLRWYGNGNMHIYIKSDEVRAKLNLEIAAHFGAQLGDNTGRPNAHDPHFTGKVKVRSTGVGKVDRNAFYTPPALARYLIDEAGIAGHERSCVLEPSCGHGALMMAAYEVGCSFMHGVENHVMSANAAFEKMKARYVADSKKIERYGDDYLKVYRCDFERWVQSNSVDYTHVVMNPPFDHQLRHVVKAYGHLAKGTKYRMLGSLVAVMGSSVMTNQNHDHQTFRAWLAAKGGTARHLPSGSFLKSGTDVEAILVKIPAETE